MKIRRVIVILVLLLFALTACVSNSRQAIPGVGTEWIGYVHTKCTFMIERVLVCDEYTTPEGTVLTAGDGRVLYMVHCDYTFPLGFQKMEAILETGRKYHVGKNTYETVHMELSSDETKESNHVLFIFEYEPHERKSDYLTINVESGERVFEIQFSIGKEKVSGLS